MIVTPPFPPRDYILEEMEARGWSVAQLAAIMQLPEAALRQFLLHDWILTPQLAERVAAAFGTSVEVWLNLERFYRQQTVSTQQAQGETYEVSAPTTD